MNQLAKNLALEWAKDNIRVNAVAPGHVMTKLLKDFTDGVFGDEVLSGMVSKTPVGRFGEPKEISSLIAFLYLPTASFIIGQILIADGGFTIQVASCIVVAHDSITKFRNK
ncbi:hypothetical protein PIB30_036076 [Stylosanthes scabra]|uniref:Uncharacterized protein n=1 Tax=Stylosanthes scabra TaxID=79078 RepID=A0ABU6RDF8_9FABA|nr:hypothetical protein [Stylosanthes scabra]